jgi:hypothetical protein
MNSTYTYYKMLIIKIKDAQLDFVFYYRKYAIVV